MEKKEDRAYRQETSSQSSDRLLQIMECLSANVLPMRVSDIASKLDLSQSTVLRYLNTLILNDYAYQEEDTLRYGLTLKIARIGYHLRSFMGVKNIASPFLNDLTKRLGVSSCLVVEQEGRIVYLDVVNNPHLQQDMLSHIGREAPMSCTSSGKIFLSTFSDFKYKTFLSAGLQKITDRSITDDAVLTNEIEQVRRQGFAIDDQECEPGIRCISAPLYDFTDRIAAALSVFSPVDDLPFSRVLGEILPELGKASKLISVRLGSTVVPRFDTQFLESRIAAERA